MTSSVDRLANSPEAGFHLFVTPNLDSRIYSPLRGEHFHIRQNTTDRLADHLLKRVSRVLFP